MSQRLKRGGWPYSQPPNVPFEVNRASPQAEKLVTWLPTLASRGAHVLRDVGGRGNHGVFKGPGEPAWISDAERGMVLGFDGANDFVNAGDITQINQAAELTITGWFNQTTLDQQETLFAKQKDADEEIIILTWNDGDLYTQVENVGKQAQAHFDYSTVVTAGKWFHYAMVFDGSGAAKADRLKVYIDGNNITQVIDNDVDTAIADLTGEDFYIGNDKNGLFPFTGLNGGVRIYDRAIIPSIIWQMAHPPTMWELYRPKIRRWLGWAPGAPPPAVSMPIFATAGVHSVVFGGQVVR